MLKVAEVNNIANKGIKDRRFIQRLREYNSKLKNADRNMNTLG